MTQVGGVSAHFTWHSFETPASNIASHADAQRSNCSTQAQSRSTRGGGGGCECEGGGGRGGGGSGEGGGAGGGVDGAGQHTSPSYGVLVASWQVSWQYSLVFAQFTLAPHQRPFSTPLKDAQSVGIQ